MKSSSNQEVALDKQVDPQYNKLQGVELALTHDQFIIIQHFLPKGLSLLEKKSGKREKASSHKFPDNEVILDIPRIYHVFLAGLKILKKTKEDQSGIEPRKWIDF